jgi:hypothetical protein
MLPPDEKTALEAVKRVQSLSGPELEKRVHAEIGDPMLAMFVLLAKNLSPEDDDQAIGKKVHTMILAYLIRGELSAPAPVKGPKRAP